MLVSGVCMYYVYILQNQRGQLYKGYTSNLYQRFTYHEAGLSHWTSTRGPWSIVYLEICSNKSEALSRERFLKSGKGRSILKDFLYP
jgi:putative endonuclease